jgi:hypothetical protein
MAFGRRKNDNTSTSSTPAKQLPKTMPSRFADGDPRSTGHETTYQGSRGGWLRSNKQGSSGRS